MTEAEPDEQELLAAEYVLGTLDADERVRARTLAAMDPSFLALVRAWERRLGELNVLIAAAAAGIGALREMHPEYFPAELRPKMKTLEITKTVEIPSPKPAQFVAVLEKDGAQPAFLVTFDLERRTVMARNVSAPVQAGKSYQLRLIYNKLSSPRWHGIIGAEQYT